MRPADETIPESCEPAGGEVLVSIEEFDYRLGDQHVVAHRVGGPEPGDAGWLLRSGVDQSTTSRVREAQRWDPEFQALRPSDRTVDVDRVAVHGEQPHQAAAVLIQAVQEHRLAVRQADLALLSSVSSLITPPPGGVNEGDPAP